jgi:hypothetical protein
LVLCYIEIGSDSLENLNAQSERLFPFPENLLDPYRRHGQRRGGLNKTAAMEITNAMPEGFRWKHTFSSGDVSDTLDPRGKTHGKFYQTSNGRNSAYIAQKNDCRSV